MSICRVHDLVSARVFTDHGRKALHTATVPWKYSRLSSNRDCQVNTSQIGQGILNSSYVDIHPELAAILDSIPPFLQDDAEDMLNEVLHRLGIHDFYTANLMTVSEFLETARGVTFPKDSSGSWLLRCFREDTDIN